MDKDGGYAGGNFKKAWEAMIKRYEDTDVILKSDLKQLYYETKMDADDVPSLFVVTMEKLRNKLANEASFKVSDEDFMLDILAKLPKGKQEGEMGPYQIERRIIEREIKNPATSYDLEALTLDLEKVYNDINGKKDEDDDDRGEKEHTDKAFAAYSKQFKGRCRKCGKYGHMGKDCRNQGNGHQGGNKQSGYKGKHSKDTKRFTGKCFYCNKPGHLKQDCKKRIADQKKADDQGNRASEADEIAFCAIEECSIMEKWRQASRDPLNARGWGYEDSESDCSSSDSNSTGPPPLVPGRLATQKIPALCRRQLSPCLPSPSALIFPPLVSSLPGLAHTLLSVWLPGPGFSLPSSWWTQEKPQPST